MDWYKKIVQLVLFIAFVPGVLFILPQHGRKFTVLMVHAVLFAGTSHFVMQWLASQGLIEPMGNYLKCPAGFRTSEDGKEDCIPVGTH